MFTWPELQAMVTAADRIAFHAAMVQRDAAVRAAQLH
jgi:hypothetical protein